MSSYSSLHHLECSRCGLRHDPAALTGLCSRCAAPLLARYDLESVAVSPYDVADRPPDLWRYHELLPVSAPEHVVSLGEGMTPMLAVERLGVDLGIERLLIKDDGLLPTGSFKARGAAVGVSRARELGATRLAMPTNGNAGAAWSAYAARAGLSMLVAMPEAAPRVTRLECTVAGAAMHLVDGVISDAGALVAENVAASADPWFDVATLKEPYRIEGKKTMGYEIAEQLGWRMPDVIIYPTGGGVGLIGIHKALQELLSLGWVTGDLPRLVCVQSTGCAPIVRAFQQGAPESVPWPDAETVAFGLTVPKALGDFLVLQAVAETRGTAVAVPDEDLLSELGRVAQLEGMLLCPEGSATVAAARQLREAGWIRPEDEVVLLNTGASVLYPDALEAVAGGVRPHR